MRVDDEMKSLFSLLSTSVFAALFAVSVGCQPPAEEGDTDTSVDTSTETVDSNMTTGAETPDANVTTGTETP